MNEPRYNVGDLVYHFGTCCVIEEVGIYNRDEPDEWTGYRISCKGIWHKNVVREAELDQHQKELF